MSAPPGNAASSSKSQQLSSATAYTAFNAVDDLVAKPVLGSDGAAKWQSFSQQKHKTASIHNAAPTAPLKALDRAVGFTSWKEEREYSNKVRQSDVNNKKSNVAGVYTHFSKSKTAVDNEISSKERKRIERRIIGDDQDYFIPSASFMGWKFDYVFTTKASHGTGYYFDGMDSIKKLNGQLDENDIPPTLKTSPMNDASKKRASNVDEEKSNQRNMPKTKKKKSNTPSVVVINNPNHPLEQVAAILAQRAASRLNPALPNGWESARTADGKEYYYNRTTGERTWDKPSIEVDPLPSTLTESASCTWNATTDPVSGKTYYFNPQTGETSWELPNVE